MGRESFPGREEPCEADRLKANRKAGQERPAGGETGGQSQEAPVKTRDASRRERGPGTTAGRRGRGQSGDCFAAVSAGLRWVVSGWLMAPGTSAWRPRPCLSSRPFMASRHTHAPASSDLHDPRPNVKVTSSGEPSWIEPCWSTYHVHLPACPHSPNSLSPRCAQQQPPARGLA